MQNTADRLRAFVNAIPDLLFVLDEDGRYIEVLSSSRHLLYSQAKELLGRRMHDVLPKRDADTFLATIRATLETGLCQIVEYTLDVPAGTRTFEGRTAPLHETIDGRRLVVWIARDISDRHAAEAALRTSQERLRHAQKMEAIGRLAGGIAHDFNNLLTAMIGYSDMLLSDLAPEHPHRRPVEEIHAAARRAAKLTHQLLAFSRKQILQTRVLDPRALILNLDSMLRRLIGENIELVTDLPACLGFVRVDPTQFEQVIINLVLNARDAMPDGGRILIKARIVDQGEEPHPPTTSTSILRVGKHLRVSISDTGVGMDRETMARLFEPYFTTKAPGKGTGLGLSSVYGIIKQSDGRIAVQSEPGQGSTFTFWIPSVPPAEARPSEPASVKPANAGQGEAILLVDDEDSVRTMTAEVLRRNGYGVLEAPDGHAALAAAAESARKFNLLLTDVVMPAMDGPTLAARLRERLPQLPVLFMSGYADADLANRGLGEAEDLLRKPFALAELLQRVKAKLAPRR